MGKKSSYTTEQLEAFSKFRDGNNILLSSVAGSGKTTVIIGVSKIVESKGGRATYISFNKSIREEMNDRLLKNKVFNTKAVTLHALGLDLLKRNTKKQVSIKANKLKNVADQTINSPDFNKLFPNMTKGAKWGMIYHVLNIFEFCRYNNTMNFNEALEAATRAGLTINKKKHSIEDIESVFEIFINTYKLVTLSTKMLVIDFSDMIFLPVFLGYSLKINSDYLFLDEIQDFNKTQMQFINTLIKDSKIKQFVAVGDPKQGIYGFCGSDPELFESFLSYKNTVKLNISYNFRCAYGIINEANKVYNNLKTNSTVQGIITSHLELKDIPNGSLVISRRTSVLLKAFFTLLGLEKPVSIKGENVLGVISGILNKYKGYTLNDVYSNILDQIEDSTGIFEDPIATYLLKEDLEIIELLLKNSNFSSISKFVIISKLKDILEQEPEDFIQLCTIHKAKGLEADTVTILNISDIPLKSANTHFLIEQEYNLKYVALTRAKTTLNYITI